MKKLGLLVMPLMTISFLANCGGGSTPSEDIKFSIQESSVTVKENNTIEIHLDWNPSGDIIEFNNFTFSLIEQSSITSTVNPETAGDRPLALTVAFKSALSTNDKGNLSFDYNDKTAKKEGKGKVENININIAGEKPSFYLTDYTVDYDEGYHNAMVELNWVPAGDSITFSNLDFAYKGEHADSVTAEATTSSPAQVSIYFGDAGLEEDVTGTLSVAYTDTTTGVTGEDKIKNIIINVNEPPVTTYHISMVTDGTDIEGKDLPTDEAYVGTISVTAENKILDGLTLVTLKDSNTDITSYCDYNPAQDNKSASLEIPLEYLTNDIEVEVSLIDEPGPGPTGTWTLKLDEDSTDFGNLKFKQQESDSITIDEYIGVTDAITMTFIPGDDYKTTQFTIAADDDDVTVENYLPPQSQSGEGSFSIQKADGFADGDEITLSFTEPTPPVPTDPAAEFKLVIPNTNDDLTFAFTCNGSKELTVDWGDETKTDEHNSSHTYASSGSYDVSIYREDITNVNVTDDTSKSYITEINFKDKITSIADEAFSSCANLTSVNISKNVTSIGVDTFSDCNALSTIKVASSNFKYDSRNNCNAIIEKATNTLVKGCNKTSIPDTVTAIEDYAFKSCSGLKVIVLSNNITSIGDYAFAGCISLIAIGSDTSSSSLTSIGDYAFSGCNQLTDFILPDSLLTIGAHAFENCTTINKVQCSESASLTSIGDSAFENCTSLSTIEIPDSIISVGYQAFKNSNLTYVTENKCKYLAGKSGNQHLILIETTDRNITTVTINNSCKVICGQAFINCMALTSINIPDNVISICDYAFYWCNVLKKVTISNSSSLVRIGNYAFTTAKFTTINIPNKVTYIGNSAFSGCNLLASINIPDKVTYIGNYAFSNCHELSTVNISNSSSLSIISDYAFEYCDKLTSINVPNKVTYIGFKTFSKCNILEAVNLTAFVEKDPNKIPSLGDYAFNGCDVLKLKVYDSEMAEIFKKKVGWKDYANKIQVA